MKKWALVLMIGLMIGGISSIKGDVLLFENFDGPSWPPPGWQIINGPGYHPWWARWNRSASVWYPSYFVYSSPYGAVCWWDWNPSDEWLITPEIDLTDYVAAWLTVRVAVYINYGDAANTDRIRVSTDGGATWDYLVDLRPYIGSGYSWYTVHDAPLQFDLTPWCGQKIKIGFWYYWTSGMQRHRGVYGVEDVLVEGRKGGVIVTERPSPPPTVGAGCPYPSIAKVKNISDRDVGPVTLVNHIEPGGYSSVRTIPSLGAYEEVLVTFDNWSSEPVPGVYYDTIYVSGKAFTWEHNAVAFMYTRDSSMAIEPPPIEEDSAFVDSAYYPVVSVTGVGCNIPVLCTLWAQDGAGNVFYLSARDFLYEGGGYKNVLFDSMSFAQPDTYHFFLIARTPWFTPPERIMINDEPPPPTPPVGGDTFKWDVKVVMGGTRDAYAVSIDEPTQLTVGEPCEPKGTVKNEGTLPYVSFKASFIINHNGEEVYKNEKDVENLEAGSSKQLTFAEWTPIEPGDYELLLVVSLPGDQNPANDTTKKSLTAVGVEEISPERVKLRIIQTLSGSGVEISYALPTASEMNLAIYDLSGKLIRTLVSGRESAGEKTVIWDRRDTSGKNLPAGIYFVKLTTPEYKTTRKVVLTR